MVKFTLEQSTDWIVLEPHSATYNLVIICYDLSGKVANEKWHQISKTEGESMPAAEVCDSTPRLLILTRTSHHPLQTPQTTCHYGQLKLCQGDFAQIQKAPITSNTKVLPRSAMVWGAQNPSCAVWSPHISTMFNTMQWMCSVVYMEWVSLKGSQMTWTVNLCQFLEADAQQCISICYSKYAYSNRNTIYPRSRGKSLYSIEPYFDLSWLVYIC